MTIARSSPVLNPCDSSILMKVTLRESTLLVGRPTAAIERSPALHEQGVSFAVVQIISNALVMFQSVENADATGSKTVHLSVDNVSSLVNTDFECVPPSRAPPMIGPTGAEFRIVYSTECFGCIVSQDVSLNCDTIRSCLTPNDLSIMVNVCSNMLSRLRSLSPHTSSGNSPVYSGAAKQGSLTSLLRYQKRGTGIATALEQKFTLFLSSYSGHSTRSSGLQSFWTFD